MLLPSPNPRAGSMYAAAREQRMYSPGEQERPCPFVPEGARHSTNSAAHITGHLVVFTTDR